MTPVTGIRPSDSPHLLTSEFTVAGCRESVALAGEKYQALEEKKAEAEEEEDLGSAYLLARDRSAQLLPAKCWPRPLVVLAGMISIAGPQS